MGKSSAQHVKGKAGSEAVIRNAKMRVVLDEKVMAAGLNGQGWGRGWAGSMGCAIRDVKPAAHGREMKRIAGTRGRECRTAAVQKGITKATKLSSDKVAV